eukprot:scaffold164324_cov27-Tisochrysis_lutea.AAC.4
MITASPLPHASAAVRATHGIGFDSSITLHNPTKLNFDIRAVDDATRSTDALPTRRYMHAPQWIWEGDRAAAAAYP